VSETLLSDAELRVQGINPDDDRIRGLKRGNKWPFEKVLDALLFMAPVTNCAGARPAFNRRKRLDELLKSGLPAHIAERRANAEERDARLKLCGQIFHRPR
jgi:hypothetical protein